MDTNEGSIAERVFFAFMGWMIRQDEKTLVSITFASILLPVGASISAAGLYQRIFNVFAAGVISTIIVFLCTIAQGMQIWRWKLARYGMDQERIKWIQWGDFEGLMELFFRLEGYEVVRRGGNEPDGGIDLIVLKDGKKYVVQCKQYRWDPVGVSVIRETIGAMHLEKLDGAIVATTGSFSIGAYSIAERLPALQLIAGPDISLKLREHEEEIKKNAEEGIFDSKVSALVEKLAEAASNSEKREGDWIRVRRCGKCGSRMILKINLQDKSRYWACEGFPKCQNSFAKLEGLEREILASGPG